MTRCEKLELIVQEEAEKLMSEGDKWTLRTLGEAIGERLGCDAKGKAWCSLILSHIKYKETLAKDSPVRGLSEGATRIIRAKVPEEKRAEVTKAVEEYMTEHPTEMIGYKEVSDIAKKVVPEYFVEKSEVEEKWSEASDERVILELDADYVRALRVYRQRKLNDLRGDMEIAEICLRLISQVLMDGDTEHGSYFKEE